MAQQEIVTEELINQISESKSPEFIRGLGSGVSMDLSSYLNAKLAEKGLKKSAVIKAAQLNETFGYQIFSGQRKASRDKVLALGLAMGLDLHDMRLLLAHANLGDLYPKNRRDAVLIYCVSHGFGLIKTDEALFDLGLDTVSDAGDN